MLYTVCIPYTLYTVYLTYTNLYTYCHILYHILILHGYVTVRAIVRLVVELCCCWQVTRTGNFPGLSQRQLNEHKRKNPGIKAKWEEKRRANTAPGRKSYERVDLKAYKDTENYADIFEEGVALTMQEFLVDRGFDPDTFESEFMMKRFIEQDICR